MRMAVLVVGVLLLLPGRVVAQEWDLFVSKEDSFKIDFPGTPTVTEMPWKTEQGYTVPSRIYSVERGKERYSITVVDYNGVVEMGIARNKTCPSGAETCQGQIAGNLRMLIGPGYAIQDIRGAMTYAAFKFIQRDAKVTAYLWNWQDLVEGMMVQLTNADRSRTYASISMHDNRLYIVDGTAPPVGYPPPIAFQQNFSVIDGQGRPIRYQRMYSNRFHGLAEYPVPPRVEQPQ